MFAAFDSSTTARQPRGPASGSGGGPRIHFGRRRRRQLRLIPLAAVLVVIVALAITLFGGGTSSAQSVAVRFTTARVNSDYAQMYALLDTNSQRTYTVDQLAGAYRSADETATAYGYSVRRGASVHGSVVSVPVQVHTRVFGTISASFSLPVTGSGDNARIAWSPQLAFPGLRQGERLSRHTTLPHRAALLARGGQLLAAGGDSAGVPSSPLGGAAADIVGTLGPIPGSRASELRAEGVPPDANVGLSGLELIFDGQLRGAPGGTLLAGSRVLAASTAHAAPSLRTTISPSIQSAAVTALAGALGGIIVLRPASGEILGVAGLGYSDLQPPGSTFKMVTVSGVLQYGLAKPQTTFPIQTYSTLSGVQLQNANGEACGGTLANAFAVSCNSVFAPLGAKLGARRLVDVAQRLGFNEPPGIPGAATSTIPAASQIGDDLAVGSTAIGQGQVLATPLEMALVASTIAMHGRRPLPTLQFGAARPPARALPAHVASTVEQFMLGVVRYGTGTAAQIPGVAVAGKTGTAELTTTQGPSSQANSGGPSNTDAWFAAFAPAGHPRVVVGVMLVHAGAGGAAAAPLAHDVLVTALKR